jgi:hypothetical protein
MADYYTPTVIQQTIPDADMTPLERLIPSHIFDSECDGEGCYFFSEQGPVDMILVDRAALEAALAESQIPGENVANTLVREHLTKPQAAERDAALIDLDLSMTSWESIMQDIVRRSPTLNYVSVVSSFTCSRMRSDGFGGAVVVISADSIIGKSTNDLLEEFIEQVAPSSDSCPIARRAKRRSLSGSPEKHLPSCFRCTAPAAARDAC